MQIREPSSPSCSFHVITHYKFELFIVKDIDIYSYLYLENGWDGCNHVKGGLLIFFLDFYMAKLATLFTTRKFIIMILNVTNT